MNVNAKGNIGLLKTLSDLYSKDYSCFTPFDDYNPVDCIAMKGNKLFRLQVKYRSPDSKDRYEIAARSVVNGKRVAIDRDLIDYWAIYMADIDQIIYMPVSAMDGKGVHYITRKQLGEMDERLKSAPC